MASALQLASDFTNESEADKKLFLFMEIDALVRRAELAKHVDDLTFAITDFKQVVALCEEYPEGNQPTLISATFCMGKCQSELQLLPEAKECFKRAITILKRQLPDEIDLEKEVKELIKPSIFDNESVKQTKE